ncbi:hypothetical protein H9639_12170 [Arthrobacter sp. Sa2CUA1]|uniref:Uncharacterized protein n=1 Tax=Arthrobacter gallicola TaxID=2762225 RepID=A0ABR8UU12_9MICC|nr:hypothetical protein [Arthrobacter gallicola]MBD7996055.1 hypothetical protein [Arthrobacter gallicola]
MKPARGAHRHPLRRAASAAAAGGLVAAAMLAGTPAAHAADDFLQISLDGTTFGASASGSVFATDIRYVPGGTTTGSIWVRNTAKEPAQLSAAALTTNMDAELQGFMRLAPSGAGSSDSGTLLGAAGECVDLRIGNSLAPGATRRLDLTTGLTAQAPNQTMGKQARFQIVLLLDAADSGDRSACDAVDGVTPVDPQTGNPGPSQTLPSVAVPSSDRGGGNTAAVVVAGTPGAVFPAGQAAAAAGSGLGAVPKAVGGTVPETMNPAGFIESTVEPITRTLAGALMTLLAAVFFGGAVHRIGTTRRTS